MKKTKYVLYFVILINIILLLFNINYLIKSRQSLSANNQEVNNISNDIKLNDLMNYLNTGPDKEIMSKEFGLIKIAADPLYELSEYEGCDKSDNDILSISYGIEGMYKISKDIQIKITIIKDNTSNNGYYILTKSDQAFETSLFKVDSTYLIFDTFMNSNLNDKEINKNMLNVIDFEQKFYNLYNNYLENIGS